jgi:hypothetical protein
MANKALPQVTRTKSQGSPSTPKGQMGVKSIGGQSAPKGQAPTRQATPGSYPTLNVKGGVSPNVTPPQQGPGGVYPDGQVTPVTQAPVGTPSVKAHKFAQPKGVQRAPKKRLV